MARRRVSATGFGGSPGLSILSGVAKGTLQREKIDRENRRQAILNRLSAARQERIQQSMRHAEEDQQFEEEKRQRMRAAMGKAVPVMRDKLLERGLVDSPSEAESLSFRAAKHLLDFEQTQANLVQTEAATEASEASTRQNLQQIDITNDKLQAMELAAVPGIMEVATHPGLSAGARRKAVRANAEDMGMEVSDAALGRFMQSTQELRQSQGLSITDVPGGGGKRVEGSREGVASFADKVLANTPDKETALKEIQDRIDKFESQGEHAKARAWRMVGEEIRSRSRDDRLQSREAQGGSSGGIDFDVEGG